jgi:pantoate--beta-alanine ligase
MLYQALRAAEAAIASGERDPERAKSAALSLLACEPRIRIEYFELVDRDELQPVAEVVGPVLVAAAVWLGATRLIDNLVARP